MEEALPISQIIRVRTSRRTYLTEALPETEKAGLADRLRSLSPGPLGTEISFNLISLDEVSDQKLKLGTYGFIRGARYFIAGQIRPARAGFLDYGYTLENLILELTRLGYGTCWLGGTFNRGEFAKAVGLREGNVIPAITPVGYATASRGLNDRLIRLGAGSANRIEPQRLFFNHESGSSLELTAGHPYQSILDSVRLAPSASNNQPWRITVDGNLFRFFICRKPGYQKAFSQVDMQMIDMGIAMSHFELVSRESGFVPQWTISGSTPHFQGWEYVISVLLPG